MRASPNPKEVRRRSCDNVVVIEFAPLSAIPMYKNVFGRFHVFDLKYYNWTNDAALLVTCRVEFVVQA